MVKDEEDLLDACEDIDFSEDEISDEDLDGFVLFADVDSDDAAAVAQRSAEIEALSNGS